ncbi:MAG: hypothetical protein P1U63_13115 [Coxiellaceae bacterium]|nr:hypothetical protein [Coxiellaceae bacterium]
MKTPLIAASLLACGLAFGPTLASPTPQKPGATNLTTDGSPGGKVQQGTGTKGLVPEDDPGKQAKTHRSCGGKGSKLSKPATPQQ